MDVFTRFAPDLPPTTPGALREVADLIPTARGYKGRPAPVSGGYPALAAAANSLAVVTKLDGSRRVFAGTAAALYEAGTGSWTDRSAVGGYAIGANRWSFAQFGDTTVAAAKAQTLQSSTSGAFAAISGAPKASWVDVSGGFVMIADTNEGTYGDQSDRWWCSGYLDVADWTPSVTTQCTTGRLVDVPGPIMALKALGGGFVAYKGSGLFVASYVGAPSVWQWQQVPGEIGCLMGSGVVSIGSAHVFWAKDNLYLFDGARPVPIADEIREWLFSDLNNAFAYRTVGTYDPVAGNVWWFYVSTAAPGSTPDKALVWNARTGRFGLASLSVEAAALYYQPGLTFDGLGTVYSTYDDLPTDLSFDSPYWSASSSDVAYIDTSHVLQTLSGTSASSSLLTGNYGNDDQFVTATRVRPRFLVAPLTASLEHLYDDLYGDAFASLGSVSLYEGKFDVLWSSRWHRFRMSFTGDVEIEGVAPQFAPDGDA